MSSGNQANYLIKFEQNVSDNPSIDQVNLSGSPCPQATIVTSAAASAVISNRDPYVCYITGPAALPVNVNTSLASASTSSSMLNQGATSLILTLDSSNSAQRMQHPSIPQLIIPTCQNGFNSNMYSNQPIEEVRPSKCSLIFFTQELV